MAAQRCSQPKQAFLEGHAPARGHGGALTALTPHTPILSPASRLGNNFVLILNLLWFQFGGMMPYLAPQPLISTHAGTHARTALPDSITHVCSRPLGNLWIQTNFSFLTCVCCSPIFIVYLE